MVWSRPARSPPGCRADGRGPIVERTTGGDWAGGESRGTRIVDFVRGDLGLLEGPAVPQIVVCRVSRSRGVARRHGARLRPVAWSRPPAAARDGTPRALPCSGRFGRQQSVRELSARARARGARGGRGRAGPRAGPQPGPRPQACRAARSELRGPCRPLRPALARSPPSSSRSPAGRAGPRDPVGSRLVASGRSGPGGGLLAMSSARDTNSRFPLHLLVWNNDYRQLEKELRDQVRCAARSWDRFAS